MSARHGFSQICRRYFTNAWWWWWWWCGGGGYGSLSHRYGLEKRRIFFGILVIFLSICYVQFLYTTYGRVKVSAHTGIPYCAACECDFLAEAPDGASLREEILSFDGLFERHAFKHFPEHNKFIFSSTCAGLGNQLFKFAAIYGLGKLSSRQPFFSMNEKCQRELEAEMINVFPGLYGRMHFYSETSTNSMKTYVFKGCCPYNIPEDFLTRPELVIRVNGAMQNYRWFHDYRHELRVILECAPPLREEFRRYNHELIGAEKMADAHHRRVCIHTRLGDFVGPRIASTFNYTVAAIDRVLDLERIKYPNSTFSVVLLGIDKLFLQSVRDAKVKDENEAFHNINYYIPRSMPRAVDMCYGIHTCDTIVITAAVSTFSWWMAYLAKSATIYYNTDFERTDYKKTHFLPEWIPLSVP